MVEEAAPLISGLKQIHLDNIVSDSLILMRRLTIESIYIRLL